MAQEIDDQPPVEIKEIIPAVPPPKVPPIPKASQGRGNVQPMTYTTEIKQTVGPSDGNGNGNKAYDEDLSYIAKADRETVRLINKIAYERDEHYAVRVFRIRPLPSDELNAPADGWGSYGDIMTYLNLGIGNGIYRVRVARDGMIMPLATILITIGNETLEHPSSGKKDSSDDDVDEIKQLQKRRKLAVERKLTAQEERETEKIIDKESKESNQVVDLLKAELKALREEIRQPRPDNTVAMITAMAPIITAMVGQRNSGSELKDVVTLLVESNKTMVAAATKKEDSIDKQLLGLLFEKQLNAPSTGEALIKAQERGEDRILKLIDRFKEENSDSPADDIDPKAGWGNLWLVFKWVINAVKEGGPALIEASKQMGKTPEEMTQWAQSLTKVNPQPTAQPSLQAPPKAHVQTAVPFAAPVPFTSTIAATAPFVPTVEVKADSPAVAPIVKLVTNPPSPEPGVPQPSESPAVTAVLHDDLKAMVEECVRDFMLVDLKAERAEHEWPDFAFNKFHKSFLTQFAQQETHMHRINLIQSYCTPETWKQIEAELPKGRNWDYLQWALTALLTVINNPQPATATTATQG